MKIANRYEVIREIGKGGMANVYLAFDTILNRQVAIKILKGDMANDPVSLERFKREANTSTKLFHPNAVEVYDVGEQGNMHYIVMEYVKGHTLKQLIQRRGALPPKEAVWIMKQLTGALLQAHKNGIIHRDIKSQNVLIKDDGTVKLADFGIAVLNDAMQLTSKGSILGSVHYLAPELAKGGQASMQSDIYSLGIVFYELLTGDVPFKADSPVQVALEHINKDVPRVRKFNPEIPVSVENIVVKATARSLEERYDNAAIMLKDLERCLSKEAMNDKPIVLVKSSMVSMKSNEVKDFKKKKKSKTTSKLSSAFIIVLSILSLLAILIILMLTGVIGPKNNPVTVPSIKGLSLTVAEDVLSPLGLGIDSSNIKWVMTDDTKANIVIDSNPKEGDLVEKGTKLVVTVSEGCYATIGNYVGLKVEDAKGILQSKNFNVKTIGVESDKEEGTILEQSMIAGSKYNPDVVNEITLTYATSSTYMIPFDILGKNVDDVVNMFKGLNFNVSKDEIAYESLTDNQKKYEANTVVGCDPSAGTLYSQNGESCIHLMYYTEKKEG